MARPRRSWATATCRARHTAQRRAWCASARRGTPRAVHQGSRRTWATPRSTGAPRASRRRRRRGGVTGVLRDELRGGRGRALHVLQREGSSRPSAAARSAAGRDPPSGPRPRRTPSGSGSRRSRRPCPRARTTGRRTRRWRWRRRWRSWRRRTSLDANSCQEARNLEGAVGRNPACTPRFLLKSAQLLQSAATTSVELLAWPSRLSARPSRSWRSRLRTFLQRSENVHFAIARPRYGYRLWTLAVSPPDGVCRRSGGRTRPRLEPSAAPALHPDPLYP